MNGIRQHARDCLRDALRVHWAALAGLAVGSWCWSLAIHDLLAGGWWAAFAPLLALVGTGNLVMSLVLAYGRGRADVWKEVEELRRSRPARRALPEQLERDALNAQREFNAEHGVPPDIRLL